VEVGAIVAVGTVVGEGSRTVEHATTASAMSGVKTLKLPMTSAFSRTNKPLEIDL
jgi:hypothetical protein